MKSFNAYIYLGISISLQLMRNARKGPLCNLRTYEYTTVCTNSVRGQRRPRSACTNRVCVVHKLYKGPFRALRINFTSHVGSDRYRREESCCVHLNIAVRGHCVLLWQMYVFRDPWFETHNRPSLSLSGTSLHRAFHYHPFIVSIWPKLCWKRRKWPSYRPCHAKTCLRAYANSEGPDQTAHPRSLIRAFTVR